PVSAPAHQHSRQPAAGGGDRTGRAGEEDREVHRRLSLSGLDVQPDPGPGVVDVALGVPELSGVARLAASGAVPRSGDDFCRSGGELDVGTPSAPGPTARLGGQPRLLPNRTAVGGDVDTDDAPVIAREPGAANPQPTGN